MRKNKQQNKKAKLAVKTKKESFRFQVAYAQEQKEIDLETWGDKLESELDTICGNGLAEDLMTLQQIVADVRKDVGVSPEPVKNSLNDTLVPFILGITNGLPASEAEYKPAVFAEVQPLQVFIAYGNEVRNTVVDWIRAHYDGVTTRMGQPILKLKNMVLEIKRVV